jgi:3'-phosphoadenosine 5'-phosphosulfate (PAPS) 3'-phosphatase
MVVWVDPLDGTLSYVNNEFDAVTTLIGLSIDKDPVLGVIGIPYPGVKDA